MRLKNSRFSTVCGWLLPVVLLALAGPLSAATMYKWIDEDGNVRYSDRMPPSQSKQKHQQLNSHGVVISTKEAALTDEERAASEELKKLQAEEQKRLEEEKAEEARQKAIKAQEDRVLLLTFASEEEIEHARDNRIEVITSIISLIEASIVDNQEKLDALQASADKTYVSKGKEIPGGLQQKIEHFTRKIENRNAQLEAKNSERDKIRAKYETDLERYRSLKSASN